MRFDTDLALKAAIATLNPCIELKRNSAFGEYRVTVRPGYYVEQGMAPLVAIERSEAVACYIDTGHTAIERLEARAEAYGAAQQLAANL